MMEQAQEDEKSKSQIKRELQELQVLGKQLMNLPDKQFIILPVSEKLRDAIFAAKKMKHGALSRQLKYIGGLMPDEDEVAIRSALNKLTQAHQKEVNQFHEIEMWRDRLLEGDKALFEELANSFANFEIQYVNQLIRNAKNEQKLAKPPKSARALFKYLSTLQNGENAEV